MDSDVVVVAATTATLGTVLVVVAATLTVCGRRETMREAAGACPNRHHRVRGKICGSSLGAVSPPASLNLLRERFA